MPNRRAVRGGLGLLVLALAATGVVLALRPRRLELAVGVHRIYLTRPRGFEVVPQDGALLFRDGPVLVELKDLGAPGADPDLHLPLEVWVDWGLRTLDSSKQREVARRGSLHVQGRELQVVETWDVLTHGQRRRFAFARNESSLLALYTRGGDFGRAASAFESVLRGFEFVDAESGAASTEAGWAANG